MAAAYGGGWWVVLGGAYTLASRDATRVAAYQACPSQVSECTHPTCHGHAGEWSVCGDTSELVLEAREPQRDGMSEHIPANTPGLEPAHVEHRQRGA